MDDPAQVLDLARQARDHAAHGNLVEARRCWSRSRKALRRANRAARRDHSLMCEVIRVTSKLVDVKADPVLRGMA